MNTQTHTQSAFSFLSVYSLDCAFYYAETFQFDITHLSIAFLAVL